MTIAALMREMEAAGAPLAAIIIAVEAIEKGEAEKAARRRAAADRKAAQRQRERDCHATITGQSQGQSEDNSPQVSPNDIYSNPHPNPTSPDASHPPRSRAPKADPFPKPDWADGQVWADFLSNRKRKKLPNTATAYGRLLADIDRVADSNWPPGRLLTVATGKGWGAIYPSIKTLDDETGNGQRPDKNRRSSNGLLDAIFDAERADRFGAGA